MIWWFYEIIIYVFLFAAGAYLIEFILTYKKRTKSFSLWFGFLIVLIIVSWIVVFYGSFIEPKQLIIRELEYKLTDQSGQNLKIVFASDFHVGPYKKTAWIKKIVKKINTQEPDLILLGGDFVSTDPKEVDYLTPLIDLQSKYGVFAVTGNHEYETESVTETVAKLESLGIVVLRNQNISLKINGQVLNLVGIDDLWFEGDLDQALQDIVKDQATLLVSHNPDIVLYPKITSVDLIFSGHTHGGQIRLPLIGAVARPPTILGRGSDQGLIKDKNRPIIISSGLGETGPRARLFNQPEILIINLGL
ncbi:metallophosphoesterase [Patescibacteria group bacterium]